MKHSEVRSSVLRDVRGKPVIWERRPDLDIECPLCTFERGATSDKMWCWFCTDHWRTGLIGQTSYWCPRHQREVPPLLIPGQPTLATALLRIVQ